MAGRLFTSESVSVGHPDKVCDQISDSILDAYLADDPASRVACEALVKTGFVVVAGEVTSRATVDAAAVVRQTVPIGPIGPVRQMPPVLDGEPLSQVPPSSMQASPDGRPLQVPPPGQSSSDPTAPSHWATTWRARRTSCPPAPRPVSPAGCRRTTFCARAASSNSPPKDSKPSPTKCC